MALGIDLNNAQFRQFVDFAAQAHKSGDRFEDRPDRDRRPGRRRRQPPGGTVTTTPFQYNGPDTL